MLALCARKTTLLTHALRILHWAAGTQNISTCAAPNRSRRSSALGILTCISSSIWYCSCPHCLICLPLCPNPYCCCGVSARGVLATLNFTSVLAKLIPTGLASDHGCNHRPWILTSLRTSTTRQLLQSAKRWQSDSAPTIRALARAALNALATSTSQ